MTRQAHIPLTCVIITIVTCASTCLAGGDSQLPGVSSSEREEFLAQARVAHLARERAESADEIRLGLMYFDEELTRQAISLLENASPQGAKANVEVIIKAFAIVDGPVGQALDLLEANEPQAAMNIIEPLVGQHSSGQGDAVRRILWARCLRALARDDAIDAYQQILVEMHHRISFCACAAIEAGELFEQSGRGLYAMRLYSYCMTNYGLALWDDDISTLLRRIERLKEIYRDPLGHVVKSMRDVETHLQSTHTGEDVQRQQQQILMLIEDLIKNQQDQSSSSSSESQSASDEEGQPAPGGGGEDAASDQKASAPAAASRLVPGVVARPVRETSTYSGDADDDWIKLPPHQRQRLVEMMRTTMPQRYLNLIRDYRTGVASEP